MNPTKSQKPVASKKTRVALEVKVYDLKGKKIGLHKLPLEIFGVQIKPRVIAKAVKVQKNNARAVLSHTKTRSERRGGGRKPWKQKGTGRARHGSIRSPIWRKGGITFGPRNDKNFGLKINAKERAQALRGALTLQVAEKNGLAIIDNFELSEGKTKVLARLLKKLPDKRSSLVVTSVLHDKLTQAARNIPNLKVQTAGNLNVLDIISFDQLLVSRKSLALITKFYSSK